MVECFWINPKELYYVLEIAGYLATGWNWYNRIYHLCFLIEKEIFDEPVLKGKWDVYFFGPKHPRVSEILRREYYFEWKDNKIKMTNLAYRDLLSLREEYPEMYRKIRQGISKFGVMASIEMMDYIRKKYPEYWPKYIELEW